MSVTKTKQSKNRFFKKVKKFLLPITLSAILVLLSILTYEIFISDKYYPLTSVGNSNISFLTQGQAIRQIQNTFSKRVKEKINFTYPQGTFTLDLATSSASLDYSLFSQEFEHRQKNNFWQQAKSQFFALFFRASLTPNISLNLDKQINPILEAIEKQPINAQLIYDEVTSLEGTSSARVQIKEGMDGLSLDKEKLATEAAKFLLTGDYNQNLPTKLVLPKVTTRQLILAKQALEETSKSPIKIQFENLNWTIDTKQLLALLDLTNGSETLLDHDKTYWYLEKISSEINQNVQEGLFEFDPITKRVSAFKPSQDGRKLDIDKSFQLLIDSLKGDIKTIDLPVSILKPKIQTQDVNSLGIKELIGQGVSNFAGSIPNRIYNVTLTASKINGVLIPPGEVFSFNNTVGDISSATGFKQAYVIKEGRTVLDDGGGVCQDSTTLFRAVLNAGLPVLKRTAHAYRVGYYEQGFPPGLDATIYYPSVDFQFKNDTEHHILIQAYAVGTTLYIDLYGTSDGRQVNLTTPVVTNITPAPPDLRQDDPTLPKGTVKQVDFAARGATVTFKRTVTKNGAVLAQETWNSFYKPWQAVFLIGTKEN
jgi:vancomycin resistance protein YoaR